MIKTKDASDGLDRLADELRNFQEIANFLNPSPGEIPDLPGIQISGLSMPLIDVIGGDHIIYIDFNKRYDLERRIKEAGAKGRDEVAKNLRRMTRRAGILVADVSGHRMTDALIAAMLHQSFLLGAYYELEMSGEITTRIFEHINRRFYRTNSVHKYFTMIYGEISNDGTFRFLSAGHPPPAVFSREFGRFMPIEASRLVSFPPVGLLPSTPETAEESRSRMDRYKERYEVNEISLLSVGDILLLYTDGFREHAGGRFFDEGLEKLLGDVPNDSAEQICERLQERILEWGKPKDDISVVVIRKTA